MVCGKIAASQNFECLGANAKFFVHALVIGAGKEWYANVKANRLGIGCSIAFTKGLAADAVGPACALLKYRRIPCKVVVNHVTTVAVEIYSFLADLGTNQDFRQERSIKPVEDAVSGIHRTAAALYQGNELQVAQAGCLVQGTPGGTGIGDATARGFEVFQEDSNPLSHAFVLVWEICKERSG
jgi:hypothetical protein